MLINEINNHKYIGQTIDLKRRIRQHKRSNRSVIGSAINKYGWDNFTLVVLEDDINDQDELKEFEVEYIEKYNTFKSNKHYNATAGGDNHSDPKYHKKGCHCAVCGDMSGSNNPMYGKHHTKESREKIAKNREYSSGKDNKMWGKRGDSHPNYKITEKQAVDIYNLYYDTSMRAKEIADRYNISDRTVTRIARCEHEGTKHLTKKEPKYNKRAKKHITKELGEKVYHEYHNTDYFLEDLADKYGISSSLVSLMQLGEHWTTKHLK